MTAELSRRSIKLALNIEEMSQYKDFVLKCPNIEEFIHLKGKTKMAVEFGIKPPAEDDIDQTTQPQDHFSNKRKEPTTTGVHIHDMNPEHLTEIVSVVVPYIKEYSKKNQDD